MRRITWALFLPLAACGPAPESPYPDVGEDVVLGWEDKDAPGFLAVDEKAYADMVASARADDRVGMAELVAMGALHPVDAGVKARVLEIRVSLRGVRVRVTEGPAAGRAGWVPPTFIRREGRRAFFAPPAFLSSLVSRA